MSETRNLLFIIVDQLRADCISGALAGFCRKVFDWLENSFRWTQLCCEGGELLECGEAGLA